MVEWRVAGLRSRNEDGSIDCEEIVGERRMLCAEGVSIFCVLWACQSALLFWLSKVDVPRAHILGLLRLVEPIDQRAPLPRPRFGQSRATWSDAGAPHSKHVGSRSQFRCWCAVEPHV